MEKKEKSELRIKIETKAQERKKVRLNESAIISGQFLTAGTEVIVDNKDIVEKGYKDAKKQVLRQRITKKAGDPETLLGVVSDASAYAIDQTVLDILAVNASENSSYKTARVQLHEDFYGKNSWLKTVEFSEKWFKQRKAKEIKMPVDIKGIKKVFADIAQSGVAVSNEIEASLNN